MIGNQYTKTENFDYVLGKLIYYFVSESDSGIKQFQEYSNRNGIEKYRSNLSDSIVVLNQGPYNFTLKFIKGDEKNIGFTREENLTYKFHILYF